MPRKFAEMPWPLLLGSSALVHVAPIAAAGGRDLPALCGSAWRDLLLIDPAGSLDVVLAIVPPSSLAAGWLIMLGAMMPPLLAWPLMYVWRSSLPRRRWRGFALFTVTYAGLWMLAGPPLLLVVLALRLLVGSDLALACIAFAAALLWSASPWQRAALNRGHRLSRIGARGWKADRDVLVFAAYHAKWCVASCWPWMMVPLFAGHWHVPVMALATVAMLAERLAPPARPRWRAPAALGWYHRWNS